MKQVDSVGGALLRVTDVEVSTLLAWPLPLE
jgi:hypothetical protein